VHLRGYRPLGDKLRSVTLRRKACKWHVCAAWDRQALDPPKIEAAPIGIDRGVAVFAATSVGQLIDPLNAFDAIRDKLAKLQRRLARPAASSCRPVCEFAWEALWAISRPDLR
jgi:putative transposase